MSASLLPNGKQQFFDANGNPLAGGSVTFYIPNTSTLKNTWQDAGQTIINSNPITLDASGEAIIYGSGGYRQVVKDSSGNAIWDQLTGDPSYYGYLLNSNNLSDVSNPATALANLGGISSTSVPSGMIVMWGASTAPTGFLECDGSSLNTTTYANLYSAIGYTFGGSGSSFNLPDFRGYFPRGWAHSGSVDSGRTLGTTQAANLSAHTHTASVTDPGHKHNSNVGYSDKGGSGNGECYSDNTGGSTINGYANPGGGTSTATTGITVTNASTGTGTDNRPINLAIMFIIKT